MTQFGFQIVNSISTVLGGGLIVIAGVALTFVYGAVGYGLSALFCGFLVYRFRGTLVTSETQRDRNMRREIIEGFRWLITQRGSLGLSLLALVFNFLFGIPTYFLVIYVTTALKAGAFLYGGILALFAAGGAGGSLLAGRTPRAVAYVGKVNIVSLGLVGGSLLVLLGLFPSTVIALGATLGIGLALGFGNTVWLTSAQNLVPTAMKGRILCNRRTVELRRRASSDCGRRHPHHSDPELLMSLN